MSFWGVKRTDDFSRDIKKYRNNYELLRELEQRIERLREDPVVIGGELGGRLHGSKSTRLLKNFRLIFSIDVAHKIVYLEAIDHRKQVYG